jgi:3-isopropylmalate dehydrogenase
MNLKIAVLSGDGIGPEVIKQAVAVLKAVAEFYNHTFEFEEALVGAIAINKTGSPLPEATLNLCKSSDAILFGAIGDPKYDNNPDAKVRPEQGLLDLRKELGLFANIRPIKVITPLIDKSPLKRNVIEGTDILIYRELTGGIYYGEKKLSEDGTVATDICEYSQMEIERITHLAFKAAQTRRNKVTLVDKANVMESSRLWRRVVKEIAKQYPKVTLNILYIDNAVKQMILNPNQFDIILTDNLFGDVLSDEGSVIVGSIGLLASASVGTKYAMFEPIHGTYPQAKGKNIANPIASILSVALLLDHFGLVTESKKVIAAVEKAIVSNVVTVDLKVDSQFGTNEVGDFVANYILNEGDLYFKKDFVQLGQSTIV